MAAGIGVSAGPDNIVESVFMQQHASTLGFTQHNLVGDSLSYEHHSGRDLWTRIFAHRYQSTQSAAVYSYVTIRWELHHAFKSLSQSDWGQRVSIIFNTVSL